MTKLLPAEICITYATLDDTKSEVKDVKYLEKKISLLEN
jgi:hypothetical protein